jgi:hypothetical protein
MEQKQQFDKRAKTRQFEPNDFVYVTRPHSPDQFQKFQPNFMGPYRIIKLLPNDNLGLIRLSDNKPHSFHANRIVLAKYQDQIHQQIPRSSPSSSTCPGLAHDATYSRR